MGIAIVREMARHHLRRVPMIGVPRAVLSRRRAPGQVGNGGLQLGPADAPTTFDFLFYQAWVVGGPLGGAAAGAA